MPKRRERFTLTLLNKQSRLIPPLKRVDLATARAIFGGPFRVIVEDGRDIAPTSPLRQALLAVLISTPRQIKSRKSLQDMFWGASGPSRAAANLRSALYHLRRDLIFLGPDAICANRQLVSLRPGAIDYDLTTECQLEPLEGLDLALNGCDGFEDWLRTFRQAHKPINQIEKNSLLLPRIVRTEIDDPEGAMLKFESILASVNAAGLDPALWSDVPKTITEVSPGIAPAIFGHSLATGQSTVAAQTGYDPHLLVDFHSHYSKINPLAQAYMRCSHGIPVWSEELFPYRQLVHTEYWDGFLRPQEDLSAGAGIIFKAGLEQLVVFAVHLRRRDAGRIEPFAYRLVKDLSGPIAHALAVNRMLANLKLEAHLLRQGLEPTGAAVIVIGSNRSLQFMNAVAVDLAARGRVVAIDLHGRFRFKDLIADEFLSLTLHSKPVRNHRFQLRDGNWVCRTLRIAEQYTDLFPWHLGGLASHPLTVVVMRQTNTLR